MDPNVLDPTSMMGADMNMDLPTECCALCRHAAYVKPDGQKIDFSVRECHESSPHMQFFLVPVMQPDGRPSGNFNIMEQSGWPKVRRAEKCSRFSHVKVAKEDIN
jgi:hypothetical protein